MVTAVDKSRQDKDGVEDRADFPVVICLKERELTCCEVFLARTREDQLGHDCAYASGSAVSRKRFVVQRHLSDESVGSTCCNRGDDTHDSGGHPISV